MDYLMWYPIVPIKFDTNKSYTLAFNCGKFYWIEAWWLPQFDKENCSWSLEQEPQE